MLPLPKKMPGNLEEKEKCLEKLNQMQKFLPFLNFMIEKIKKKNNNSLESQLSKFELLRSMITEKSRKCSWDAVVKVEDVIEKLISKLEFKEQYEKPKENLIEVVGHKAKMKTSVSIVPPSTANSSSPQEMPTESESGALPTGSVDFVMKTLNLSCEASKIAERGTFSNPSDPYHSLDKTMDTDLDKDLDGFDLTDCPNALETQSGTILPDAALEKSPSAEDLRESGSSEIQSRLNLINKSCPSSSVGERTEKASDSQTVSAFSRNQINTDGRKTKSDCSGSNDKSPIDKNTRKSIDTSDKTPGKPNPASFKSCGTLSLSEKSRSDSVSGSGDVSLKQKLKEKLSTVICEVYRVPGKSVGGSLRGLKESKDHRTKTEEEKAVNKSGKSSENGVKRPGRVSQSTSSSGRKESHRSHLDTSSDEKRKGKSKETDSHKSGKSDKKTDKSSRSGARKYHKAESGGDRNQERRSESRISKDGKRSSSKLEKNFDLHKLDDNELSEFVKENIKSLPHLSKLKPGELREALQSSLSCRPLPLDTDGISEVSDDSFHDMEEVTEEKDFRGDSKDKPSPAPSPAKPCQEGKSAKSSLKSQKEFEVVDLVEDLGDTSLDESLDEDAYALKLIEETTIKTYPKKKKESPVSNGVDLFEEVPSMKSFEVTKSSDSPSTSLESKNKPNRLESVPQLIPEKPEKDVSGDPAGCSTPSAPKEAPKPVNPPGEVPKVQQSNERRPDPRLNRSVSSHGSQDANQSLEKPPPKPVYIHDPRKHISSSEPKSYGEYKRMKLKEQEKALKGDQKSSFPGWKVAETWSSVECGKPPEQNDAFSKQNNPKSLRTYEARKCWNPKQRKIPEQVDGKEKCEELMKKDEDKIRKSVDEKRPLDSENLISPLEELYKNEEKPKTGRGYGIQKFKIPKKGFQDMNGKNISEIAGARKVESNQTKAKEAGLEEPVSKGTIGEMNQMITVESSLEENWDDRSTNANRTKTKQDNESSLDENWDDSGSNVSKQFQQSQQFQKPQPLQQFQANESNLEENWDDSGSNVSKQFQQSQQFQKPQPLQQFQANESNLEENWDDSGSNVSKQFQQSQQFQKPQPLQQFQAKESNLEENRDDSSSNANEINMKQINESSLEKNWNDCNSNISKQSQKLQKPQQFQQFRANESSLAENWDDCKSNISKESQPFPKSKLFQEFQQFDQFFIRQQSRQFCSNESSLDENWVTSSSNASKQIQESQQFQQFRAKEPIIDENWDDCNSNISKESQQFQQFQIPQQSQQFRSNESILDKAWGTSRSNFGKQFRPFQKFWKFRKFRQLQQLPRTQDFQQFPANESSLDENWDDTNSNITKDISNKTSDLVESTTESAKTDNSIKENNSETAESGNETKQTDAAKEFGSSTSEALERVMEKPESTNEVETEKTDKLQKDAAEEQMVTESEVNTIAGNIKKCETRTVECDSSMEASSVNEQICIRESASSSEKRTVLQKEDITQEFMETLIRKTFQLGEGKLLLAQVKLFEEFARKLNSKKLKTIQRIINSQSDSSSSTSESSSEDDRKRKKSKKRKKKGKKIRKYKFLSSSSSSEELESEEISEEESCDKKDGRRKKETVRDGEERLMDTLTTSEESKPKSNESSSSGRGKGKKRRRNVEFLRNFTGNRAKRKQKRKRLLEKILNESVENEDENTKKDSEPKAKPKTKWKCKTELDRLHDDVRNMFICNEVVMANGNRLCRTQKQSREDMNNSDIVNESAEMAEEEKLKKVRTRSSQKNSRAGKDESRSRSQSLEKGTKAPQEYEDPKLALEPRICLQRVDLDNFGYGIKISDDCISFRRMQGRNTAIRGVGAPGMSLKIPRKEHSTDTLGGSVFLARNKRKFQRLKDSKCKKGYKGKKLIDVVKNLPLKTVRMKHLKFCERKTEKDGSRMLKSNREKYHGGSAAEREVTKADFSNVELLQYAFEKKRKVYSCKLCFNVTRHITMHYKEAHPDHEVLISRLSLLEAEKAKLEAKSRGEDVGAGEKNQILTTMKKNMKALMNRSAPLNCRMCRATKIEGMNEFATHVSAHTGEFRFRCPVEDCTMQFFSRQDIKFHILTKHTKNRNDFYGKITELYKLTIEGNQLFGFLCSACNFVQLNRRNVEEHMSRQHKCSRLVKIVKINMSETKLRKGKNKLKSARKGTKSEEARKDEEESEVSDDNGSGATKRKLPPEEGNSVEGETTEEVDVKRIKLNLEEDESQSSESVDMQNMRTLEEDLDSKGKIPKTEDGEPVESERETNAGGNDNSRDDITSQDTSSNDVDMEDCVDLKSISTLKGSDIIESLENPEGKEAPDRMDPLNQTDCVKLKVGPLEAQLFKNSEVLYECYVKGCLFSTTLSNLFERHIEISHIKTKWSGTCEICAERGDAKPPPTKSSRLVTALRHLKLHEREEVNGGRLSPEDLILRAKLLTHFDSSGDEEESDSAENKADDAGEVRQEENSQETAENADNPYPVKPLLRVRNFLGDRLSTPKASDNGGKTNEEELPTSDTSSMFTIENVRSLQKSPSEEPELKIEQVCSLKDQLPKAAAQLGPGKTIIVRSCPTRKIAIRPEAGAVPVDGGHINVVQPPVVGHPVVLSPLSASSPIRIISASLNPKPKYTVKPIMLPAESVRFGGAQGMPVIRPAVTPPLKTLIPVTTTPEIVPTKPNEATATSTQTVGGSPLHVDLCPPQPGTGSPSTPTTSAHLSSNASDAEEPEEKDTIVPQKVPSSLGTGKKSLKDVNIYQEMLTKTKLCHFFKCMGIECSFTCDDENVFMQHIGLHEVQRRMSKNKGVKTMYLRMANRMTRAFYWQQCAYCCEVLNNSISALSQHIREEHGHCVYQCAFCFYRAVSHSYVKLHQNLAHSQLLKTAPRLIYKCKPLRPAPTLSAALEKHGRRQSVRPYHCDQCGMKFFITEDFVTHLGSEHQSVTAYTCHICKNLCFKINRLINHYKLHSYSTYQCPYCIHGTETEKEMVFHLCNFHFSQPAVMYVRALAEGQNDDEKQKSAKRKKPLSNQLDSLKVIVYESDNLNLDCIVEVDPEDNTGNNPETPSDLNSIAAEFGITTEAESSSQTVTPLMKELASIGEKGAKNITVKTLLPNAQFSSEGEKGAENCSVLISSGLSIPTDQNEDREMSIPLGQLPLEAVNVQHKEPAPPPTPPPAVESPDRNLKLNELIVNLQQKEKTLALAHSADEDKIIKPSTVILSSAVHKLPPVVLTRNSSKNLYPSKCVVMKRKPEEPAPKPESDVVRVYQILSPEGKEKGGSGQGKIKTESSTESDISKTSATHTEGEASQTSDHPLITNVVSLSSCEFEKEDKSLPSDSPIIISDVCSLSDNVGNEKDVSDSSGVVINIKSKLNSPCVLRPPIIRVEDFPIEETTSYPPNKEKEIASESKAVPKKSEEPEDSQESLPPSPDIIILEEDKKDIVTVTLDSDDEKDENGKKNGNGSKEGEETATGNETIRKEMELLRKQIANETDSLLLDEPEAAKPSQNLTLNMTPKKDVEPVEKTLLSPIEEAICSLNKKLQSETEQAQKKEEKEKKEKEEKKEEEKAEEKKEEETKEEETKEEEKKEEETKEETESKGQERRRTRFGVREKKREAPESDGDEASKKEDPARKRFKEELSGKALFICGNEKCSFAAEDDSLLKDHLFVCDLSRESSVLVCPHCSRPIKQFHAYLEHLRYHGEKKFHCGLCPFSSAVDQGTSRHVKQKHKCSAIKVLLKEGQEGHFVYYPKNYKVEKVDFEANGYSPGDEDKLPLQSVYQVNVKCAKCPYFTKVRSNMVRHLKIHVKSVETEGVVVVPSTAPTNPVPCLETKERMFDKMTNLAASSQLAQAKERAAAESLSPEEEAKLPQFVPEQMRYKCCLPDCNYITVDDGMLKHHIKALHDEISYYSCPHCQDTVHTDIRHVTLDKIGFHLKHHDVKLYKCAHCIFFHYQKNVVEKHTADKHPERRYFLHTVREPKAETPAEEEPQNVETGTRVWKCGLCDSFQTPFKPTLTDHLIKTHNTKSKYKCGLCSLKGNSHQLFIAHFASKHPGEQVSSVKVYFSEVVRTNSLETQSGNSSGADSSNEHFDTTPLWQRGAPRVRHIRGILIEEEEIKTKKTKRTTSVEESEGEMSDPSKVKEDAFYCPLCTNKKKPFFTRSEKFFRTHLYQELNYQRFACILCGKMFVDRKDFEKHHARLHPDKQQVLKQTKEDHEIKFWVDRVIAKRRQEMEERKRKPSDGEDGESQVPPKKQKSDSVS